MHLPSPLVQRCVFYQFSRAKKRQGYRVEVNDLEGDRLGGPPVGPASQTATYYYAFGS